MVKRVLIAVGGTGGHIYPAIALAKKLKEENPDVYLMFAGEGLHDNRFFDRAAFPYNEVASGYFPLRKPLTFLKSLGRVASGVWQSDRIIKEFKPDLVVGFGSYHSLPILLAAKMHSIPIILHEGNAIPGRVNRLLAKHALVTGLQFPEAAKKLKGKTVPVDVPMREDIYSPVEREKALAMFGFDESKKTLLVFGGSQGANAINRLIVQALTLYTGNLQNIQLLHFAGSSAEAERVSSCYENMGVTYLVKDFQQEMGSAWSVADLVLGRAGAGTIAESMTFEVPALLIPYPYATDDHQTRNARFLSDTVKGAICFDEATLTKEQLADQIYQLLEKDPARLNSMAGAILEYKKSVNYPDLTTLVTEFIS